ncbi:MAG: hypothetical protein V1799_02450 [bacterium]
MKGMSIVLPPNRRRTGPPKGEARRTGAPLLAARAIEIQFDTGGSQRRVA